MGTGSVPTGLFFAEEIATSYSYDTHPLVLKVLERLYWLVKYQEKLILFYWVPSNVCIWEMNEIADAATKAGLLRRDNYSHSLWRF